ncbi:MAG: hypothetical protein C0625_16785 [Arcobacter sp.]|nr:MAG: hypothetical protein C0625_16785 [Arcobacter sp.]
MNSLKDLKDISADYTILYVEDDKDIANTLINYLSKFFKEVVYAKNGEEGLELYKQQSFDIVISDINMPKMSGLEMAEEIKNINNEQNIIIISAYSDIQNFLTSIKIGIDGYIMKPVDYNDINNLLFKTVKKIKTIKEHKTLEIKQKELLAELSRDNNQLKQFSNVIDNISIVSKTDLKGDITYANDFFVDVSGYSKEELIGKTHSIIRHPDMSKGVYQELWESIQEGKVWEGTIKNRAKDGSIYFIHNVIIPLYDINKNIKEYMGIGFLNTKEEIERRQFKKKVMTNYMEFKKTNINAIERISSQDSELNNLKQEHEILKESLKKIETKYKKANHQIEFYEKGTKEKDTQYLKIVEIQKMNLQKISESHKKSLIKIDLLNKELAHLKEEHDLKAQQVIKLNEELNEQTNIIYDLRDTIKNIDTCQNK